MDEWLLLTKSYAYQVENNIKYNCIALKPFEFNVWSPKKQWFITATWLHSTTMNIMQIAHKLKITEYKLSLIPWSVQTNF